MCGCNCYVCVGCFTCQNGLGPGPGSSSDNALALGKSGFMSGCICFGPVIALWVNAFVWAGSEPAIFWPLFIAGLLIIIGWMFTVGSNHLILDKNEESLMLSQSGCFCSVHRIIAIGKLSDISKFYTVMSTTTRINNEPAVDLFVGLKNDDKVNIVSTEQSSVVSEKCKILEAWWKNDDNKDVTSRYSNIKFDWSHDFSLQMQNVRMGNNDNFGQLSTKLQQFAQTKEEFEKFLIQLKINSTDQSKAKIIDMGYESDKKTMLNEYKLVKEAGVTHDRMIQLLADKADSILKARNIVVDMTSASNDNKSNNSNNSNNSNGEGEGARLNANDDEELPTYGMTYQ